MMTVSKDQVDYGVSRMIQALRECAFEESQVAVQGHGEIVRILLSNGADVNAEGNAGGTALIGTSQAGHGKIVSLLLSNGADVNAEVSDGTTAIHMAEQQGHQEIVEILKNAGGR